MDYIVLDLEWNQPRYYRETVEKPVHLVGEIVQIGAVRLNWRLGKKKELRLLVKPQYYKKMHGKVSRITGLKNEDLKDGISFPEAFRKLAKFCGSDFVFLTWGPDDIPMLRDNLALFSLDEDWIPEFYDLQVFFAHQIAKEKRQFALEDAIEMLGEKPFQAHDALCDARSTAVVCRHLDLKKGMKDYPLLAGDITSRPLEVSEIAVAFENRGEALKELGSSPFSCPKCSGFITPEAPIPQNANKFLSLAECSGGEKYLVRFKLYHSGRKVRATREIYPMDENLSLFYEDRMEHYRQQKKAMREKEHKKRLRRRQNAAATK